MPDLGTSAGSYGYANAAVSRSADGVVFVDPKVSITIDAKLGASNSDDAYTVSYRDIDYGTPVVTQIFSNFANYEDTFSKALRASLASDGSADTLYLFTIRNLLSGTLDYVQIAAYERAPAVGRTTTNQFFLAYGREIAAGTLPVHGVATYNGETRGLLANLSAEPIYNTTSDIRLTVDFGAKVVEGEATNWRFADQKTGAIVPGATVATNRLLPAHTFLVGGSVTLNGLLLDDTTNIFGASNLISGIATTTVGTMPIDLGGTFRGSLFGPSSNPEEIGLTYNLQLGGGYFLAGGAALGRSGFAATAPAPTLYYNLIGGRHYSAAGPPAPLPTPLPANCIYERCLSGPTQYAGPYVRRTAPSTGVTMIDAGDGQISMLVTPASSNISGRPSYTLRYSPAEGSASTRYDNMHSSMTDGIGNFTTNSANSLEVVDRAYLFDVSTALSGSLDYVQVAGYEREIASGGREVAFLAYGDRTPSTSMPSTGSATYAGGTRGVYFNGVNTYATTSDLAMTANFATGAVTGAASNFKLSNLVTGTMAQIPLGFTFSGAIPSTARNSFSGTAIATGERAIEGNVGTIQGAFFGTGANAATEAGLSYAFRPSGSSTYMIGAGAAGRAP